MVLFFGMNAFFLRTNTHRFIAIHEAPQEAKFFLGGPGPATSLIEPLALCPVLPQQ